MHGQVFGHQPSSVVCPPDCVSRDPQPQKIRPILAILEFSTGPTLWYSREQPGGNSIRRSWEGGMILAALVGLSLVANTSFDPQLTAPTGLAAIQPGTQMSPHQKAAALRPLIRSANDCVARAVAANPRFHKHEEAAEVNELIVVSMDACIDAMRAMISAHDRLFGEGSGEAFFMGPYLDVLPATVNKLVNDTTE